jgi:putative membrane protein
MMGWNWDGGAWFGMGIGMLVWLLFAVLIVWVVVRGLSELERRRSDGSNRSAPDDILRERYARGEIDADEFERRLAFLHGK